MTDDETKEAWEYTKLHHGVIVEDMVGRIFRYPLEQAIRKFDQIDKEIIYWFLEMEELYADD